MKRITTILTLLMLLCMGAWAEVVTISPSKGVYWKNGAETSDAWAPIWKSTAKASDGTTPLVVLTGETGMNTASGDIYSNQTYTLEAPSGYTIVSYSFNGTATNGDVTITPNGGSGTVISNGNSLDAPLSVAVGEQTTSFALSGDGFIANLALTVQVEHYIVTYSTSTGSYTATNSNGTWASRWESTATDPQVTLSVDANNIQVSSGNIYSGNSTATYTLTAQSGYLITGYEIVGTANTAAQTLTPAAGGSATQFATSGTTTLSVSGLSTQSTSFTQSTPNNGIAISSFRIFVEDVTASVKYVISDESGIIYTSDAYPATPGETITTLPSALQRDYCTYSVTSTTLASGENTVPVTLTAYNPPFALSTSYNTATWYYLKIKNANYPTYVSDGDPNVTLPTSNIGDRTTQWAFFGTNPYQGIQIKNRAAGSSLVLGSESANGDGNSGGNTYATLNEPGTKTYESWLPKESNYISGGFFLFNSQNHALNKRSAANLAYWTGGYDAGSTFTVEAAPSDEEALAEMKGRYEISDLNLDKPGFPTTAAYNTFRSTIEGFVSLEQWEEGIAAALEAVRSSVVYPNGKYYIKNRNTGCYAFITDDGELVPRIKIDNTVSHANNNYLWTVTSDKENGTCSIVSSLYDNVPFAKGANVYSNITADNRTIVSTLSTELFSGNNGTSGGFYLNGAHNNNVYAGNGEGEGNSHVVGWNYQDSQGSQWIFEPADLGTEWTITVAGLDQGGQDLVTLADGTIVNLGTGTVYLSEAPTVENITQSEIAGYSILDGSIAIDNENKIITVTYSPSYDVLIANYITDNNVEANVAKAGQIGYPAIDNDYAAALSGVLTAYNGGSYTGNAMNYNNLRTWYEGYLAAAPVLPTAGFYRIKSSALQIASQPYLSGENHAEKTSRAAFSTSDATTAKSIWYYNGTNLINYGNGGYAAVENSNFLGVATALKNGNDEAISPATVAFETNGMGEFGALSIKLFGATRYLYTNAGLYTDAGGAKNANGYSFNIEEVESLPVTVSAVGYATFYAPVAVTIPEGVKAYTGKKNDKYGARYLTMAEVEGVIPANTGVILEAEAGAYDFEITTAEDFDGENALQGVTAAQTYDDELVLGIDNENPDVVGFFRLNKTVSTVLPAFKAYLPSDFVEAGARVLIDWTGETTGIETIGQLDNLRFNKGIYDLQGRRVSNPQHGLYIMNGKKVVIK
ncbi:MAG: hypothetical protein IJS97_03815 [Prevotella sp.]|nr:hypothetical protein [Prevotella sp.]